MKDHREKRREYSNKTVGENIHNKKLMKLFKY